MKTTLYDNYIASCLRYKDALAVCGAMEEALEQTKPIAHVWHTASPLEIGLPATPITWPDTAMCLCVEPVLVPGLYEFCVDQGYSGPIFENWIEKQIWSLDGLLLFQLDDKQFDVIPLVRSLQRSIIMPEIQLHFAFENDSWTWRKAVTGPVNAYFHDVLIRAMEKDETTVEDRIERLGNIVYYCLGTYYVHISKAGDWFGTEPQKPKLKIKNGKIKKIYKQGTVGYKQYTLRDEV